MNVITLPSGRQFTIDTPPRWQHLTAFERARDPFGPLAARQRAIAKRRRASDMKYIAFVGRRYRVTIKGQTIGLYDSREQARRARDHFLRRNECSTDS